MKDKHGILKLAFLVDVNLCNHLIVLNLSLQRKNIQFPEVISNISAFKSKLVLYRTQLENYDYSHFENFKKCDMPAVAYPGGKGEKLPPPPEPPENLQRMGSNPGLSQQLE